MSVIAVFIIAMEVLQMLLMELQYLLHLMSLHFFIHQQFDIQSVSSKVKYLNLTGGNSVYCGGIEIRRPEELVFSYQTITHMKSWFCFALTDVINEDYEIEYSNILSVSLISGEAEHPYPGIIHIRAPLGSTLRFTISHFIFYDTDFPQMIVFYFKEEYMTEMSSQ